jgi:DNA-binding NarL/FixJ family response regulator
MSERLNGEVIIIDDKPQGLENLRKLLILERFDALIVSKSVQILSEVHQTDSLRQTDTHKSLGPLPANILRAGDHQQIFIISLDLKSEDPFDALSRLQATYPNARYAFIGTTFDSKQAEDFFAAGVNAFFTKPISADKFIRWVTNSDPIAVDVPTVASDRAA